MSVTACVASTGGCDDGRAYTTAGQYRNANLAPPRRSAPGTGLRPGPELEQPGNYRLCSRTVKVWRPSPSSKKRYPVFARELALVVVSAPLVVVAAGLQAQGGSGIRFPLGEKGARETQRTNL